MPRAPRLDGPLLANAYRIPPLEGALRGEMRYEPTTCKCALEFHCPVLRRRVSFAAQSRSRRTTMVELRCRAVSAAFAAAFWCTLGGGMAAAADDCKNRGQLDTL